MTKGKGAREDRSGDGRVDNAGTSTNSRTKRDRESGSEGSPITNKKANKPTTLNTSKGGEEIMEGRGLSTEGKDTSHPRATPSAASGEVVPQDERMDAMSPSKTYNGNRKQLVESQLKNKYNSKSLPLFIIFVECNQDAKSEGLNLGNMHPMAIARSICVKCGDSNITKIRSVGKLIQEITFGSFEAANGFVEKRDRLPKEWSIYIPNFRVRRSGCGARR